MKRVRILLSCLLSLALFASGTPLAQAQPKQQLAVRVVNAAFNPASVVVKVRIALLRDKSGSPVTAGLAVTDANGRCGLRLTASVSIRARRVG